MAGDDVARFYRAATPVSGGRRSWLVEAFHWGRFTSGSPSRALWLVLIPFALLNVSRYMMLLPSRTEQPKQPEQPKEPEQTEQTEQTDKADKAKSVRFADVVLRLFGLILTLTLVTNVVYTSWDIVIHQCTNRPVCVQDNGWLSFLSDWDLGARLLFGLAPLAALISLLWWFGRRTFLHEPPGERAPWATETGDFGDHGFWYTSPTAPVLRDAHVAAACAVTGILLAGTLRTDFDSPAGTFATRSSWYLIGIGGALLFFALVIVLAAPEVHNGHVPKEIQVFKWVTLIYLVVSTSGTIGLLWTKGRQVTYSPLVGFETVTNVLAGLVALLLVALAVACVVLRFSRPGAALMSVDKPFRPMWWGFAGLAIAAFAALLATAFSSGLTFRIADLLGQPVVESAGAQGVENCGCDEVQATIVLSTSYWTGSLLWGVITIAFGVLLLPLIAALARQTSVMWWHGAGSLIASAAVAYHAFVGRDPYFWILVGLAFVTMVRGFWRWFTGWRADDLATCVAKDYPEPGSVPGIPKTATMWRLALTKYRYHWVLGMICTLGGVLVAASGTVAALRVILPSWRSPAPRWLSDMFSDGFGPVADLGAWVVSGVVTALVVLGVRSWQGQKMRTGVGVVWDLIAFWPRLAHPICPPPYGGRAALALSSRVNYLVKKEYASTVVLSGHSQGSLVCVAAVCLLKAEELKAEELAENTQSTVPKEPTTFSRLRLVTYGSPMQWAFARFFPSYIGRRRINEIYGGMKRRWHNLYRWTDPIGGPVLVSPTSKEVPHPGTTGWTAVDETPHPDANFSGHRLVDRQVGPETRLRDPESLSGDENVRPRSELRGHSAYYADLEFNEVVARVIDLPGT